MSQVEPADVPLSRKTVVTDLQIMGREIPHGGRPHQKAVLVVVEAPIGIPASGPVVVDVERSLQRVAGEEEVLAVEIRHRDGLVPGTGRIEAAIGVLLQKIEPGGVPLDPVRRQRSEKPRSRLAVGKHESAEIAQEPLHAGAQGQEVVARADVGELDLAEGLLDPDVLVRPARPCAHVDVDHSPLAGGNIVEVQPRRQLHPPVHGTETRVAVKQIERQEKVSGSGVLATLAEELPRVGPHPALAAGGGKPARLDDAVARGGQRQEGVLADDRYVPLENVLTVRIQEAPAAVGIVADAAAGIPVPFRQADAPAVGQREACRR